MKVLWVKHSLYVYFMSFMPRLNERVNEIKCCGQGLNPGAAIGELKKVMLGYQSSGIPKQ